MERVAVAVVDLAGLERRADRASSSPVEKNATRACGRRATSLMPSEASMPISAGLERLAAPEHDAARLQVLAGEAAVLARLGDGARAIVTRPSRSSARSCITTVSAPAGMTPPVKMRTAWPGPIAPACGCPANDSPTRVKRRSRRRRQVGEAHGPAVHRRVVVPRHVDRRDDVGGEGAPERLRGCAPSRPSSPGRGSRGSARAPGRPASSSGRSRRRRTPRAASAWVRSWRPSVPEAGF